MTNKQAHNLAILIPSMRRQNLPRADVVFILKTLHLWDAFIELAGRIEDEDAQNGDENEQSA